MAIEAPISKFKKNNLKIYIVVCLIAAAIFAYDGYLSKYKWSKRYSFYQKNFLDNDSQPTSTMNFNRKSPPVFIAVAAILSVYFLSLRNKKLIADENQLVIAAGKTIPYDSIEKIDKTGFEKKGFFLITYKDQNDGEATLKLSDKRYDNLEPVLEYLVAKIS